MSQRRDFILLFGMDAVEGERKSQNGVFVLVSVFPLQRKKGNDGRPLLGLLIVISRTVCRDAKSADRFLKVLLTN